MTERKGVTVQVAKIEMRRRLTLIGAMLLHKGEVDGMLCGTWGTTANHLHYIDQVIGKRDGGSPSTPQDVRVYACMNGLMLPGRQVFLVDTHVNADPTRRGTVPRSPSWRPRRCCASASQPKAALLSHSNFGTSDQPSAAEDAAHAGAAARSRRPGWRSTARCTATSRWTPRRGARLMPRSTLTGDANLLVLPNIDAANIAYNLLKTAAGGGIAIGPVLLGAARPVHILTPSATVRRIVNMTALTVADANAAR